MPDGHTGNRGVNAEVTMSFMVTSKQRDRIRKAARQQNIGISEFIRKAIDTEMRKLYGQ